MSLSRKLASAGMPTDQAPGVAAAIAETLGEQIATRRDIEDVQRDIGDARRDVEVLRREMTTRIDQVETRLSARIDTLEISFRSELRQSEQRQVMRLGLMLAAGLAFIATLVNLL